VGYNVVADNTGLSSFVQLLLHKSEWLLTWKNTSPWRFLPERRQRAWHFNRFIFQIHVTDRCHCNRRKSQLYVSIRLSRYNELALSISVLYREIRTH